MLLSNQVNLGAKKKRANLQVYWSIEVSKGKDPICPENLRQAYGEN